MDLKKKIPAFTLMEVTIAMLIAAIAIAITFTAYRIVSGSYIGFSKKQVELAGFVNLDKLLKQDFMTAKNVLKSSTGMLMETEDGLIRYEIDKDYVIRDQFSLRIDTFKLTTSNTEFSFEKNPVDDGNAIDQFGFETLVLGQLVPLHYHKLYSAQDLFK
jgi:hypothetical protein